MLSVEFLVEARAHIAAGLTAAPGPHGIRRVIPITGGSFEGPTLRGEVVPGGEDRQVFRSDGALEVTARYTLKTHDGELIFVTNRGFWVGSPEIGSRLMHGEAVDPASYYFRTAARFDAPSGGPYAWLNHQVIIGSVAPSRDVVVIRFFVVR